MFQFNKYKYKATFFVPEDSDISCFDAYIGRDFISRCHLQSSTFFAYKDGKLPLNYEKGKQLSADANLAWQSKSEQKQHQERQAYETVHQQGGMRNLDDPDATKPAVQGSQWPSLGRNRYDPNVSGQAIQSRSSVSHVARRSESTQQPRQQMQVDKRAQGDGERSSLGPCSKCVIL
jgi:hypothetical protein